MSKFKFLIFFKFIRNILGKKNVANKICFGKSLHSQSQMTSD